MSLVWIKRLLASLVLTLLFAVCAVWLLLGASLAGLNGEQVVPGLGAPVTVARDAIGIPTIVAKSRIDAARALGFVHAQERMFQMDLFRRNSAGELSALFGARAIEFDRRQRLHRLRARAQASLVLASQTDRDLLEAYAGGVNAGLAALSARPPEYLLLGQLPQAWKAEDSLLVALSMFLDLNDETATAEAVRQALVELRGAAWAELLMPARTPFDAPLIGDAPALPALPGPGVFDARATNAVAALGFAPGDDTRAGSNGWVMAGSRTRTGAALVANDMHLALRVPPMWFRARLQYPAMDGQRAVDASGVSLAGTPVLISGSNGQVAWGFTNSYGDWADRVLVEIDPQHASRYRTSEGWQTLRVFEERIQVAGAADVIERVEETVWGPLLGPDPQGRRYAVRWVAHAAEANNLVIDRFVEAASAEEILDLGAEAGMPANNLMVGDSAGNIGWTVTGLIPIRAGHDGRLPLDGASVPQPWTGWLPTSERPRVFNPAQGQIWTANSRVVDGPWLQILGDGGYAFGARATQIRDRLSALSQAGEADLLQIQLDDEARFMAGWRARILSALQGIDDSTLLLDEARLRIENWSGHARADDVGYALVRAVRARIHKAALAPLLQGLESHLGFSPAGELGQVDALMVRLLDERPLHLLDPAYEDWDELVRAQVDAVALDFVQRFGSLGHATHGATMDAQVRHPLSGALGPLGWVLDMPKLPLHGDGYMPRVQGPAFGASERMVVSPGAEHLGILQLPGGQSGHPLSPFYRAGFSHWARGEAHALLPGDTQHQLLLVPR